MDRADVIVLWVDPERPDDTAIEAAVSALARGELVVLPTETVYGLAADPRVAGAMDRLYRVKARPEGKPVTRLAASVEQVATEAGGLTPAAEKLARRFWPGPLTLVLETTGGFEGFRVPAHAVALAVLRRAGHVLAVTSANRSGAPPSRTAPDAMRSLGGCVAVALDAGASPGGVASTVVRVRGGEIEVLRPGAIPESEIRDRA